MTNPDIIINQLLDELGRWRKQVHAWETTAHHLAEAINQLSKTPGYQPTQQTRDAILTYNRTIRNKYRKQRREPTL